MKKSYELIIDKQFKNQRIDVVIPQVLPEITRSCLKNHCEVLYVNGKKEKLSYKCKGEEKVNLTLLFDDEPENIIPQNIALDIVYEDKNYLVINKPYNMVVHPAKGNFTNTVVNALIGLKKELAYTQYQFRPGIVHRLDKETSGLLIIAKNLNALNYLSNLFKTRKIKKRYHAIVKGLFKPQKVIIDNFIGRNPKNRKMMTVLKNGGKRAITIIKNVENYGNFSYLDIELITGRTHQIRVHLSHLGFPILGDNVYGRPNKIFPEIPLCLVAYHLSFYDIFTDKNLEFKIDDPLHMKEVLIKIRKEEKEK